MENITKETSLRELFENGVIDKKLYRALMNAGIFTVGMISLRSKEEISSVRRIGEKHFDEIKCLLKEAKAGFRRKDVPEEELDKRLRKTTKNIPVRMTFINNSFNGFMECFLEDRTIKQCASLSDEELKENLSENEISEIKGKLRRCGYKKKEEKGKCLQKSIWDIKETTPKNHWPR